jgi:hypothetical protein
MTGGVRCKFTKRDIKIIWRRKQCGEREEEKEGGKIEVEKKRQRKVQKGRKQEQSAYLIFCNSKVPRSF